MVNFVNNVQPALVSLLLCFLALVFTLWAAYTCKFVKILQDDYAPIFIGIWKVEGGIDDDGGIGHLDNTNECIAWTDTAIFEDGAVRAAKTFSVWATGLGCVVFASLLLDTVVRLAFQVPGCGATSPDSPGKTLLYWVISCSFICCALSCLFYNVLGTELCDRSGLKCAWGAGAYLSIASIIFWAATAVFLAFWTKQLQDQRQPTSRPRQAPPSRSRPVNSATTLDGQPSHNGTVPTTTTSTRRTLPNESTTSTTSQTRSPERMSSMERLNAVHDKGSRKQSNKPAVTDRPVSNNNEEASSLAAATTTTNQSIPPLLQQRNERISPNHDAVSIGTPLISISEDAEGNVVKTTILVYADETGETVMEKTVEVLSDDDESEDFRDSTTLSL